MASDDSYGIIDPSSSAYKTWKDKWDSVLPYMAEEASKDLIIKGIIKQMEEALATSKYY